MKQASDAPVNVKDTAALADGLRRGDDDAYVRVVELYEAQVTQFVRRLLWPVSDDVEDAVQETFIRVYLTRGSFRGDCEIRAWLLRIAANVCRTAQRKQWMRERATGWLRWTKPPVPPSSARLESLDEVQRVRAAVRRLPRAEREVVVLYYLQEIGVAEICQTLGVSETAVNVRLHRARRRLQKMLGGAPNE